MLRSTESVPFGARHQALPFQAEAVLATRDLPYAALFHEQGLGKTKMALDLALHWLTSGAVDSVLVVTKKTLIPNWERGNEIPHQPSSRCAQPGPAVKLLCLQPSRKALPSSL